MKKYNVDVNENGYVRCLIEESNGTLELDLSSIDLEHLSCYKFIRGSLILDEDKLNELKQKENKAAIEKQIVTLKQELATYDYIGVKISMGVSTREEYADKISYTETLREKIRDLENKLAM